MKFNEYAVGLLEYHIHALEQVACCDDIEDYEQGFQVMVCSWLPGYSQCRWCGTSKNQEVSEIVELLSPLAENKEELNEEKVKTICDKILVILKVARRSDQKNNIAITTVHKRFKELNIPFQFINLSKEKKPGKWIVKGDIG